jgi:hypothetical protein
MTTLLLRERRVLDEKRFAELVIWRLPRALPGSSHRFKYRLAYVVDEVCVVRFDNETGKGDHKHVGDRQVAYEFASLDRLLTDFWDEIERGSGT